MLTYGYKIVKCVNAPGSLVRELFFIYSSRNMTACLARSSCSVHPCWERYRNRSCTIRLISKTTSRSCSSAVYCPAEQNSLPRSYTHGTFFTADSHKTINLCFIERGNNLSICFINNWRAAQQWTTSDQLAETRFSFSSRSITALYYQDAHSSEEVFVGHSSLCSEGQDDEQVSLVVLHVDNYRWVRSPD
jgi:hypothetical protein